MPVIEARRSEGRKEIRAVAKKGIPNVSAGAGGGGAAEGEDAEEDEKNDEEKDEEDDEEEDEAGGGVGGRGGQLLSSRTESLTYSRDDSQGNKSTLRKTCEVYRCCTIASSMTRLEST